MPMAFDGGHHAQKLPQLDRMSTDTRLSDPMSLTLTNDPDHWRKRANEARASAEQITDSEAKMTMLSIASDYERLALRAAERLLNSIKSRKSSDTILPG